MIGCRCVCHRGQAKWHLFGWCCEGAKLRARLRANGSKPRSSAASDPGWDPLLYTDGSAPAHADHHAHGDAAGHGDAGQGDAAGVDSAGGASTCGASSCGGGGCGGGGD